MCPHVHIHKHQDHPPEQKVSVCKDQSSKGNMTNPCLNPQLLGNPRVSTVLTNSTNYENYETHVTLTFASCPHKQAYPFQWVSSGDSAQAPQAA